MEVWTMSRDMKIFKFLHYWNGIKKLLTFYKDSIEMSWEKKIQSHV